MTYLIDGYNLMHAVGMVRKGLTGKGFDRARGEFLDWLAAAARGKLGVVRVVFDARSAPAPSPETQHRGLRVVFAFGQTADDRIEEFVLAARKPAELTVVSNDGRVREDARRCGCRVRTCEEFLDWLLDDRNHRPDPTGPDKPAAAATPAELAAWLAAFTAPPRRGG